MSVVSKSTTTIGPRMSWYKSSLEKKAWFMGKLFCDDLSGSTYANIRDYLQNQRGFKTRVKLSRKGWRVGSKLSLNPRVAYELHPLERIDRIVQDLQFVNVLFVIFDVDTEIGRRYELLAYKLRRPKSASDFENLFRNLYDATFVRDEVLTRAERSLGNLSLVSASKYPMGALAVDRWGGQQVSRSVVSSAANAAEYGRVAGGLHPYRSAKYLRPTRTPLDDPSDLGSLDSSDNATSTTTTTFREVAVSANPIDYDEGDAYFNSATSATGGSGEVSIVVNEHRRNFNEPSITSDDGSRIASSSVNDSGFYSGGGGEVAVAYVHRPRADDGVELIDGTVSIRKVFSRKTRGAPSTKGVDDAKMSSYGSSVNAEDAYRRYRTVGVVSSMGSRSRSIDHLERGGRHLTVSRPPPSTRSRQVNNRPSSRMASRLDFNDNESVASSSSYYYLNPKLKKTYNSRNAVRANNPSTSRLIGQY